MSGSEDQSGSGSRFNPISHVRQYFNSSASGQINPPNNQSSQRHGVSGATQILADLAPQIMQHRILNSPAFVPGASSGAGALGGSAGNGALTTRGLASLSRNRGRLLLPSGRTTTSTELHILEHIDELLSLPIPPSPPSSSTLQAQAQAQAQAIAAQNSDDVSLMAGFRATLPSSLSSTHKMARRRKRAGLGSAALGLEEGELGLRKRGEVARGLLTDGEVADDDAGGTLNVGRRKSMAGSARSRRASRGGRQSFGGAGAVGRSEGSVVDDLVEQSKEELESEVKEIMGDKENLSVRRALLNAEIDQIEHKIADLDVIRQDLRRGLLGLREEELELDDELEGVRERLDAQVQKSKGRTVSAGNSRRRKGPAFLPSEHDDLPVGVAFMTIPGHSAAITALDFTEPYGTLVTASLDDSVKLWDLTTGEEIGALKGHTGTIKCLQVEGNICVTGGTDGKIRVWDLDQVEMNDPSGTKPPPPPAASAQSVESTLLGSVKEEGNAEEGERTLGEGEGSSVRVLDGHTMDVTCLYFDNNCLVTGSSDKTLRQWDMTTGQCVLTMDILWAISNPSASQALSASPPMSPSAGLQSSFDASTPPRRVSMGSYRRLSSNYMLPQSPGGFATATPPFSDGSWEMYQDFVGGVQFWGYALASGSGDGCVRMWDMRTGQAHRTLIGHTAPVTCLQFDELHLISGSLDKSVRVWDLRTGGIIDTLKYEHPVTALQFDSRKIVTAAGENGIRTFNRTTLQHSSLTVNGHTSPVERLRFVDRYLASGGRDSTVKIWSLG